MYFSAKSARALRTIKCCALIIIGFVVAGEISILLNHGNDDPAGGIFMGILITLVALVTISLVTRFERRLQLKMEK
jgi:purine-cytosine permease-like protein